MPLHLEADALLRALSPVGHVAHVYDNAGGQAVSGSAVTVNLDAEGLMNPPDSFGLASDELTVKYDGVAVLLSRCTVGTVGTSDFQVESWIEVDTGSGYSEIPGTRGFAGRSLGPAYAGISVVDNAVETAIAVAGTAVQVTIFDTNDPSNVLTPDHTNDHITIAEDGDYFIDVSATVDSVGGAGSVFHMRVQKNNGATEITPVHCHRNLSGGGGESGVISMTGIATLSASDTIEVWIENETNTQNYMVSDISLNVRRLSR